MNKRTIKKRLVLKEKVKVFISKCLILIIIILIGLIIIKKHPEYRSVIKDKIYNNTIKFAEIKKYYTKYFGSLIPIDNLLVEEKPVFNEKLSYKQLNTYKDGVSLTVDNNYLVPCLEDGVVIFVGEKEDYGSTIIVEQTNGIDVFYGNININNINMYDYVKKGSLIGEVKTDKFYLVFFKDGKYLNYKDYI